VTRIEHHGGRCCPFLYCDECGKRIDDAGLAMAAWDPETRIVYHVHKRCLNAFERRMAGDDWLWTEELAVHLYHLVRNLDLAMGPPEILRGVEGD